MKPLTAVVKHEKAVYPYMPLEKRKKILPKRNACSLYPATQQNDAMITGNGTLRAEIYGDPFEETIVYGHELLYVPIRKNAPELRIWSGFCRKCADFSKRANMTKRLTLCVNIGKSRGSA